jgi:hypothetical protein
MVVDSRRQPRPVVGQAQLGHLANNKLKIGIFLIINNFSAWTLYSIRKDCTKFDSITIVAKYYYFFY